MNERHCPFCGSPLESDDKFCPLCGTELSQGDGIQSAPEAFDHDGFVENEPINQPVGTADGSLPTEYVDNGHTEYQTPETEPPLWAPVQEPQNQSYSTPFTTSPDQTPVQPPKPTPKQPDPIPFPKRALIALAALLIVGGGIFAALNIFNQNQANRMCTVLFETRGGTPLPSQEVEAGTYLTSPESPQKEGYIFKAWYTDAERTQKAKFPFQVTEDVVFYARYRKPHVEPEVVQHTISFETSGGSTVSAQTVDEGTKIVSPQDPTRSGYTFAGWYTDAGYGSRVSFPLTVTSDMTLFAKWDKVPEKPTTTNGGGNTNTGNGGGNTNTGNGGNGNTSGSDRISMVVNSAAPGYVNVRSSATYYSDNLYQVYPGTAMYWYGKQAQGKARDNKNHTWYYVNVAGTDVWGWVFAEYISAGNGSPVTSTPAPTPQPTGTPLTLNSEAPGYLNVRASATYYSDDLYTLYPGDIMYWDGASASGKARDNKNHTWYHVNVAGTDVWGWVFAEYTTRA